MGGFTDMKSSSPNLQLKQGKSRKNLRLKNRNCTPNIAATHKSGTFKNSPTKNEVICNNYTFYNSSSSRSKRYHNSLNLNHDSDMEIVSPTQKDNTKYSELNPGIDITSCKPCSVILNRLSEKYLQCLITRKNSEIKNVRNILPKRRRPKANTSSHGVKYIKPKIEDRKFLIDEQSRTSIEKHPANRVNQKRCAKVAIRNISVNVIESDESNKSAPSPYDEKFYFNSTKVKNHRKSFSPETIQIENLLDYKDGRVSPVISKSKSSLSKCFKLSSTNKALRKTRDETAEQEIRGEILVPKDLELKKKVEDSEDYLPFVTRAGTTIKEKVLDVEDVESCKREICFEMTCSEDANNIESGAVNPKTFKSTSDSVKHIKLPPLKKKSHSKTNVTRRRDSHKKITVVSYQITENVTPHLNRMALTLKRQLVDADIDHKLKKFKRIDRGNSARTQIVRDPKNCTNVNYEQKLSSEIGKKIPTKKNVGVLLTSLEKMAIPSTFKHLDENAGDTQVPEIKLSSSTPNSPSKSRSTKITDYFFKIDKNQIALPRSSRESNEKYTDSMLRNKFGIRKKVVILLNDCVRFKNSNSKYLATKIFKKHPNSAIGSHVTVKGADKFSSSSSVFPNQNTASRCNKLLTNDIQTSDDDTNVSVVDHRQNTISRDSLNTITIPHPVMLTRLPIIHKSLPVVKSSAMKNQKYSINVNTSERRTLRPRNEKQLANSTNDIDFCFVDKGLIGDQDNAEQNLSTNVNELENRCPEPQIDSVTPNLSETLSSELESSVVTQKKHIDSTSDPTESNESEMGMEINEKTIEASEVRGQGDIAKSMDVPEDLIVSGNESLETTCNTLATDEDANAVANRLSTDQPTFIFVKKSPIKLDVSNSLSVNGMALLSRGVLEENNSWMALDNVDDDVAQTGEAKELKDTEEESGISYTISIDEITKDKTRIYGTTSENADGNALPKINIDTTAENEQDTKNSVKFEDENSKAMKFRSPKRITILNRKPSASANLRTGSSSMKSGNSMAERSTNLVTRMKEDQKEPPSESLQEGRMLINTDRCESDSQPAEIIFSSATFSSGSSTTISVREPNSVEQTKELSGVECIICKKSYKNKSRLEDHLKVHIDCTKNSCILCDKTLIKTNAIKHYLEHCDCPEVDHKEHKTSDNCDEKYRKRKDLRNAPKSCDSVKKKGKKRYSQNTHRNQCDVCSLICKSEIDLFAHLYAHTPKELQSAFQKAQSKQLGDQPRKTNNGENRESNNSEDKIIRDKKPISAESNEMGATSQTLPLAIQEREMSICSCHKDERLEISNGVIIEVALVCMLCSIFFKYKKCLTNHFASTSCSWDSVIRAKMFCNKCSMIINTWAELLDHLMEHNENERTLKTSFLCKRCNICFFGIGSQFHNHWLSHDRDPMFLTDHTSFPKNIKVKIVASGSSEFSKDDEPTQSLFIPEHQCAKCEKLFQSAAELKIHSNSSISCSKKADTSLQINQNSKTTFKLICSICNKEFTNKSTFDNHIKDFLDEHEPIKDFLPLPRYSVRSPIDDRYTCGICNSECKTMEDYKKHSISHEVIQENFYCNHCALMLDSVEEFEHHSAEHKGSPEKPVVCKVVFPKAMFHCKPCRLRFDNKSTLDKHLVTHRQSTVSRPKLLDNKTSEVSPVMDKEISLRATDRQEIDQVKLAGQVSTTNENVTDIPTVDPTAIRVSTDIVVLSTKKDDLSKEPVAANILQQGQPAKANTHETKKPPFLRVKNLKELLPYACVNCKAEFDTQVNHSSHVCTQSINTVKIFTCTLCKNHQGNNKSDYIKHVMSHFPPRYRPKLDTAWFNCITMPTGEQIFKCNICPNFRCLLKDVMQFHFHAVHSDFYRQTLKCRVCNNFETDKEQEINKHEASHFLPPSPSVASASNSSPVQPIENSTKFQPSVWIPLATTSNDDTSLRQPAVSTKPLSSLNHNMPTAQQVNNYNIQELVENMSVNNLENNLSSFQQIGNFVVSQQSNLPFQLHTNPANFQQQISNLPASRSSNNLQSVQPFDKSQQLVGIIPLNNNTSHYNQISNSTPAVIRSDGISSNQSLGSSNFQQQPVTILSAPPVLVDNSVLLQMQHNLNNTQSLGGTGQLGNNSNDFQSSIQIPPVTNGGCNMGSINWITPQQPRSACHQESNNSNNFQQSISIPPVTTSSAHNLTSLQPSTQSAHNLTSLQPSTQSAHNLTSLQPSTQTFQIQINTNSLPFNTMTNVMHTMPDYVANLVYTCNICKNFKCSSEQELQTHKDLHEFIRFQESPKRFFRCKICTNIFCPSEEHLKVHIALYHNGDKSKSQIRIASNATTTTNKVTCQQCHQSFASSTELAQHVVTTHKLVDQKKK